MQKYVLCNIINTKMFDNGWNSTYESFDVREKKRQIKKAKKTYQRLRAKRKRKRK